MTPGYQASYYLSDLSQSVAGLLLVCVYLWFSKKGAAHLKKRCLQCSGQTCIRAAGEAAAWARRAVGGQAAGAQEPPTAPSSNAVPDDLIPAPRQSECVGSDSQLAIDDEPDEVRLARCAARKSTRLLAGLIGALPGQQEAEPAPPEIHESAAERRQSLAAYLGDCDEVELIRLTGDGMWVRNADDPRVDGQLGQQDGGLAGEVELKRYSGRRPESMRISVENPMISNLAARLSST